MAIKEVGASLLEINDQAEVKFETATSKTDGFGVAFGWQDTKTAVILNNTAGTPATFTVKANEESGAVDFKGEVPANGFVQISLDSNFYKQMYGENKGKIVIIPSETTLKCACVYMR